MWTEDKTVRDLLGAKDIDEWVEYRQEVSDMMNEFVTENYIDEPNLRRDRDGKGLRKVRNAGAGVRMHHDGRY